MKNKKYGSLSGIILMIALSIFSLIKNINSENVWKISASAIGVTIFVAMFIYFSLKLRNKEIN